MKTIGIILFIILCLSQAIYAFRQFCILYKINKAFDKNDSEKLYKLWKKL